jgi:hypothetical protein
MPSSDRSAHILNNLPNSLTNKSQPSDEARTRQYLAKGRADFITLTPLFSWLAYTSPPTGFGRLGFDSNAVAGFGVVIRGQTGIDAGIVLCVAHVESLEMDRACGAMAGTSSQIFGRLGCNVNIALSTDPVGPDQPCCNKCTIRLAAVGTYILCTDCIVILLLVNCFLSVRDDG